MIWVIDRMEEIVDAGVADLPKIFKNTLDSKPDRAVSLWEYSGTGPYATFGDDGGFGSVVETFFIQVRSRDTDARDAESLLAEIDAVLLNYDGDDIIFRRASQILPLGRDSANPPRWDFTANYEVTQIA